MTTEVVEALTRLAASPVLHKDDAEPLSRLIKLADAGLIHDLDKHLEDCTPLEQFLRLEITGSAFIEGWGGGTFAFTVELGGSAACPCYEVWLGDTHIIWSPPRSEREEARIEATPEYQQQQEEFMREIDLQYREYYAKIAAKRSAFHLV